MKILLIQPPWYGFQNIVSHRLYLGLAYIGAVLEQNGHEVLILNGENFFKKLKDGKEGLVIDDVEYKNNFSSEHYVFAEILNEVKKINPDVVGVSFMTAVSSSAYIIAKLIKDYNKNITLVAGGWHPTLLPEEPLKKHCFDFCVRGEGEETIVELVEAIQNNSPLDSILGISYKNNELILHNSDRSYIKNLDLLPLPGFHLLHDYKNQKGSCKGIETSRGCPFACSYCASKVMWSRATRFKSPDTVVSDIFHRYTELGITNFSFNDDTFTLNKKRVAEICHKIINLKLKITWHCDTRGDTLDLKTLRLMKKSGCNHIYLGLESGSEKILKLIKKDTNTEVVKNAVAMARKAGIETTVYFMMGFPEENENDIQMSINAMNYISPDNAIWSILTLYPGTEIWNIAKNKNLVTEKQNWDTSFHHYDQGNIFGSISKESWNKMIKIVDSEQKKLHERMTVIKFKKKIAALPDMVKLGLKEPNKIRPYFVQVAKKNFKQNHKMISNILKLKSGESDGDKISILMPVYNGEKYLAEAINSILHQTYTNFEFIIINDGSNDRTAEIINSFNDPRIRVINNLTNLGLVVSLNTGINQSTCRYIARMDSDDISLPKRLEIQKKYLDDHQSVGIVGSRSRIIGENHGHSNKPIVDPVEIKTSLLFSTPLVHPSVMMRRDLLISNNLFYDVNFKNAEDYDLWSRASQCFDLANINEVLLLYRMHPKNISKIANDSQRNAAKMVRLRELHKINIEPTEEELLIHQSIKMPKEMNIIEFLEQTNFWLRKILTNNIGAKYHDAEYLNRILRKRWFIVCYSNNKFGKIIWKKYWESEFKHDLNFMTIKNIFKLYLKTHL